MFLYVSAVNFICDNPDIKAISFVGSDRAVSMLVNILALNCCQIMFYVKYELTQNNKGQVLFH